jgi:hypothetical protein
MQNVGKRILMDVCLKEGKENEQAPVQTLLE